MRGLLSLIFLCILGVAGHQVGQNLGWEDPEKYGQIFAAAGVFLGLMVLAVSRSKPL